MNDKPPRKFYSPTPRSSPEKRSEPTTAPPPFDLEAFARETTASDADPAPAPEPPSQSRPKLSDREAEGQPTAYSLLGAMHASMGPGAPQSSDEDRIAALRECFSWGDYAGALTMADLILVGQPDNLLAREIRAKCRATLEDVYAFRLGPLDRIPMVVALPKLTGNRVLDNRTRFLLSLIDGSSTLESILVTSALSRLDALRALHDLVQRGVVAFQ